MSDLTFCHDRADRRERLRRRLQRSRVPCLLMSLSAVPGLVSLRVDGSAFFALLVSALTALSVGAAVIVFRPR